MNYATQQNEERHDESTPDIFLPVIVVTDETVAVDLLLGMSLLTQARALALGESTSDAQRTTRRALLHDAERAFNAARDAYDALRSDVPTIDV
jgi:hypothetical protein